MFWPKRKWERHRKRDMHRKQANERESYTQGETVTHTEREIVFLTWWESAKKAPGMRLCFKKRISNLKQLWCEMCYKHIYWVTWFCSKLINWGPPLSKFNDQNIRIAWYIWMCVPASSPLPVKESRRYREMWHNQQPSPTMHLSAIPPPLKRRKTTENWTARFCSSVVWSQIYTYSSRCSLHIHTYQQHTITCSTAHTRNVMIKCVHLFCKCGTEFNTQMFTAIQFLVAEWLYCYLRNEGGN